MKHFGVHTEKYFYWYTVTTGQRTSQACAHAENEFTAHWPIDEDLSTHFGVFDSTDCRYQELILIERRIDLAHEYEPAATHFRVIGRREQH